ncbi:MULTISPECIES: hypothetical protein [unclassified Pseudomonas]|uniref:hypothetical protein n=1 Tax=unclassified Pseudomonas TaxID=196821 RepID=UPI001181E1CD|nr:MULTISPECIES: hypothetical protein [unclassified Pseudomonas]
MKVDIREVVSSYCLDVFGHKIQARITKGLDADEDLRWEISHFYRRDGMGNVVKPEITAAGSKQQALDLLRQYCDGFQPGYSPAPNSNF